jgi:hypothetical protein
MEREDAWDRALQFVVKSDMQGDVCEFGCYRGRSLSFLHKRSLEIEGQWRTRSIGRFFAFDSFEGMPALEEEDVLEGYNYALGRLRPGRAACSEEEFRANLAAADFDLSRLTVVKGFYADTLVRPETAALMQGSRCALLHIDCDFESSAAAALGFIEPYLQDGCVVLFDDWFLFRGRPDKGVRHAFETWLPGSGYTASHYFHYAWCGNAFILHERDR